MDNLDDREFFFLMCKMWSRLFAHCHWVGHFNCNDNRVAKSLGRWCIRCCQWKLEKLKTVNCANKNERKNKENKEEKRRRETAWEANVTSSSAANDTKWKTIYTLMPMHNAMQIKTILTNITDVHFICNNKNTLEYGPISIFSRCYAGSSQSI